MKQSAVYISGPMTGWAEFNKPWFTRISRRYELMGVKVFNPHTFIGEGLVKFVYRAIPTFAWYVAMARDLVIMLYASRRYLLLVYAHPAWIMSRGARIEVWLARKLGVGVI